jgi:hypothetical protein
MFLLCSVYDFKLFLTEFSAWYNPAVAIAKQA